ncbi:mammalian cell entry protein [Mycolicibacterium duvalii]|uniref:Mce associated membrane protein n=1 Tax=Mycolicibacterium duvalii TaxID=39688 RepID=A0A7I7JZJ7_9MYCO|nr:mammalian cell entry protein [Mycolicibacterium duvalii]MCV7370938.1 mammalian cell entry protein [Mycolicibacterium duvalii]PEG41377.1 mammalian cell entry protein [Mycolicibacterium duvalii]BBX17193.1 Mce associated membrane protein [Mycolicibacterium duvalii]
MGVDADTAGKLSPSGGDSEEATTTVDEFQLTELDGTEDYEGAVAERDDDADPASKTKGRIRSPLLLGLIAGLVSLAAVSSVSIWLGYQNHESRLLDSERERYLEVARQGAVNLTTIDHQQADTDIQRILDAATGQFYDDFVQRSQPFVDVVKNSQSTSQGTVTEAGLESFSGEEAQAIVAVSVTTSVAGAPEQQARSWRMRLTVQKSGEDLKISNVGFVA